LDKGTNGGKPTSVDKINGGFDALDAATSATKEVVELVNKKANENAKETKQPEYIYTTYDPKDPNKNHQVLKSAHEARQKKKNDE
jgi:hypothetical protein